MTLSEPSRTSSSSNGSASNLTACAPGFCSKQVCESAFKAATAMVFLIAPSLFKSRKRVLTFLPQILPAFGIEAA